MINFIICDDEEIFRNLIKEKVDSCMMKSTIEYKTHFFESYNEEFFEFIGNINDFNVYFLDIQTADGDGTDIARYIRYKLSDWSSLIVFVTNYSEYENEMLTSRLDILDFIKKTKQGYEQLEKVLSIVLFKYQKGCNCLTFERNHIVYKIKYKDIVFIEREFDSKTCLIYTRTGEYKINKSLSDIEKLLDDRFFRTHRSAIINVDKVIEYDTKNNKVIFSTGEVIDLVSRNKRKELKERVLACSEVYK